MSREDLRKTRIENLQKTQAARKEDARERVYEVVKRIEKIGGKINFHTVAKEANVSVSYLYKYAELKQHIASLRSKQSSIPQSPATKPVSSESHSKVVGRFKDRIHQLESQNRELRRKNEALAGQVYRVHHLQAIVERQQQSIEDLQTRLKEAHEQKSVVLGTPISTSTLASVTNSDKGEGEPLSHHSQANTRNNLGQPHLPADNQKYVSDKIKAELDNLDIQLNSTLLKTIKSTSETLVLNALEALKEAMAKVDVPSPGGWLTRAIQEGWTKNVSRSQQTPTIKDSVYTAPEDNESELIEPAQIKELLKGLK